MSLAGTFTIVALIAGVVVGDVYSKEAGGIILAALFFGAMGYALLNCFVDMEKWLYDRE